MLSGNASVVLSTSFPAVVEGWLYRFLILRIPFLRTVQSSLAEHEPRPEVFRCDEVEWINGRAPVGLANARRDPGHLY